VKAPGGRVVGEESRVRSASGLIPWHTDEEQGCSIQKKKEWGIGEEAAGRPGTLEDFYAAHGLCLDCLASGAQMIGRSNPTNEIDIKAASELGLEQLPLYEICPTCDGTGRAERSRWRSVGV
jgi:hypothetical protein